MTFVRKRTNECDTQTDEDMYDQIESQSRKAEIQPPKPDMTNDQVKTEVCEHNTNSKDEDESCHSARYPKRDRRPPQYYKDCDYEVKCKDQALLNIDYIVIV